VKGGRVKKERVVKKVRVEKICNEMMNLKEEEEGDSIKAELFVEEEYGEKLHEYMKIKDFLMEMGIKTEPKDFSIVDNNDLVQTKSREDNKVTMEEEIVQEFTTKKVEHEYTERGQGPPGPPNPAMVRHAMGLNTKSLTSDHRQQIIAECCEDMVSPTDLARKWSCNADTIRSWVRKAGRQLPKQYKKSNGEGWKVGCWMES